ncbi:hypothetical protein Y032_0099g3202 [Ancylostoma ceylanicum]|uniref:Uncharacterized protein n=1 Tax=Ancylostoma ceylanicum TaxID=53326 RepID=A0A016TJ76_9BILA|nr:hypothetical protein Y032_0099g3202 [Ancylostoma ceylanicum]
MRLELGHRSAVFPLDECSSVGFVIIQCSVAVACSFIDSIGQLNSNSREVDELYPHNTFPILPNLATSQYSSSTHARLGPLHYRFYRLWIRSMTVFYGVTENVFVQLLFP